jgi:hypothetical protein
MEKELQEKNIEYRMMNVECRNEKPFDILRFDILLFCGLPARGGFAASARCSFTQAGRKQQAEISRLFSFLPSP